MTDRPKPKRSVPHGWPAEWPIPEVEDRTETSRFLHAEAGRIIHSQKALIAAGINEGPIEDQLKRAVAFHNVARFIEACAPYRKQVLDLLTRLREEKSS